MKLVSERVQRKTTFNLGIVEKVVMCAFSACIWVISANNNSSVVVCLRVEAYIWPLNIFSVLRLIVHIFFTSYILVTFVMNSIRHFTLHCFHSIIFQTN